MGSTISLPQVTEDILSCGYIYRSSKPKSTCVLGTVNFEVVSEVYLDHEEVQTRVIRINVLAGDVLIDSFGDNAVILSTRVVESLVTKNVKSTVVVTTKTCAIITPVLINGLLCYRSKVFRAPSAVLLDCDKYICGCPCDSDCRFGYLFTGETFLREQGYSSDHLGVDPVATYVGAGITSRCGRKSDLPIYC